MNNTTIIVPCYNESKRLDSNTFKEKGSKIDFNILFVDDGSTDNTTAVLKAICQEHPSVYSFHSLKKNVGKAEAIRISAILLLENESNEYIGYLDADLATTLESMNDMVCFLKKYNDYKAVFGIRLKRLGVDVNRSLLRHYFGRVFATVTSFLLGLPTYDTQCGAKVLDSSIAKHAFSKGFISKWFFDIEILFRLKNKFGADYVLNQIYEYPIMQWFEEKGSKIGFTTYLFSPFELIRIYWNYRKSK